MEGIAVETTEQPAKIYDLDTDSYVDNPMAKKPEVKEESEEEEKEEEKKPEAKKTDKPKTEDTEEEEEEEEEEEGGESEIPVEEEEEEEEDERAAKKEEDEEALSPDDFIKTVYEEKYGIKTQAELDTMVDNAIDLVEKHEKLQKDYDLLKADAGKIKFTSDKEERAYNFIKKYDVDRQGEALDTYAKLITMDIDNSDPTMILEEKFVHENPHWTRAEAQRMFQKEFKKKYTLKKEDFDSEEEYNSELADVEILKKGDVARAKSYLKDQQEKYKPAAKEEKPKVNEAVTKAVEKNARDYVDYAEKADEVSFGDGDDKYIFALDKAKKQKISEAMGAWVKNPSSYNDKGELEGIKDASEMFNIVVGGLFLKDIVNAAISQVKNKVASKRIDEVAETKPKKRQAPGSGDAKIKGDDLDEQALMIIKKKKAA
jgi:hypothetical protein